MQYGIIFYVKGLARTKYYLTSSFIDDNGNPEHVTTVKEQAGSFTYNEKYNMATQVRTRGGKYTLHFKAINTQK